MMSNYTLKRELAEFAASLVQPGETIFIENGSSNALLARTLGEQKKNVTIITVSSYIAHLLKMRLVKSFCSVACTRKKAKVWLAR